MNSPRTIVCFVNAAHFLDHYAMLIFAAAVVVMAPAFDIGYSAFLAYATPGFVAFGAGSLITGWLGDRWSRRHMMAIYFFGMGLSMLATGGARTPLEVGLGLFAIGAFAAIYHPVGTAMLVAHADRLGRQVGLNGVWGNLGVSSAALVTGVLSQYLGWRAAFVLPGVVSLGVGVAFLRAVAHEPPRPRSTKSVEARIPAPAMRRVVAALAVTIVASSTTFNALTVALPKLFAERLADVLQSPVWIGFVVAAVYLFGALAQFVIGSLVDRHALKTVFLPVAFSLAPLLAIAAFVHGWMLVLICAGLSIGVFGQVTINDSMVARYTRDEWRSRAYAVRYFVGFTAAGAAVALVAWLHERGGFALVLESLGGLCLLITLGALIFPDDRARA